MHTTSPSRRIPSAIPVLLAAVILAVVAGCSPARKGESVQPPVMPGRLDLSTPESSVRTYLDYTTLAYRMANSEAASQAATPVEGVRVDSYIELNRQKGRGIEQRLVTFTKRSESAEGTRVVVAASEEWRYRYFSLSTLAYVSTAHETSYETTYTLVKESRGWLVDRVEAKALTPVK